MGGGVGSITQDAKDTDKTFFYPESNDYKSVTKPNKGSSNLISVSDEDSEAQHQTDFNNNKKTITMRIKFK